MNNEIMIIKNVRCYQDKEGIAQLNMEDVARGLGFTELANSGNEVVRWRTVRGYLKEFGIATCCDDKSPQVGRLGIPEYIPENIFYKLCFKAKNEIARKFQDLVTDEVLPSIRKNGGYLVGQEEMTEDEIMAKALLYANNKINDLKAKNGKLQIENSQLLVSNETMKPKADYFDDLVDRNLLTNFTETAKELNIQRKKLINFLLKKKYIYRDKKGKILPYADKNKGLFEVKEAKNDKTEWSGTQTLITPKGRETFKLLCIGL